MKSLLIQFTFAILACVIIYHFISIAKSEEGRARCSALCGLRPALVTKDQKASSFELPDLQGNQVRLQDLIRSKPVLLNFWVSSCEPCKEELPNLEELAQMAKKSGEFYVVTVSTDPDKKTVIETLNSVLRKKPSFEVLLDPESNVVNGLFGTKLFPETWMIDKKQMIRARFDGARDWSSPLAIEWIVGIVKNDGCQSDFVNGKLEICEEIE